PLRRLVEPALAMRTAGRADLAHCGRVRIERPRGPRTALAPTLAPAPATGLVPMARRQAGVLRRPGRQLEPCLELRHLLRQAEHQLDQLLTIQHVKIRAIHPKLESRQTST